MAMWRQKTQEERKMLNEFWVSRSSFGLTVIQTPITLCNKLSPQIVVFKQQSFDNYTQFMSWQCGSSDVGWLRLESPFIHESILCKGREWGLAGLGWPQLTCFSPVCILSHNRHVQVCFHDCQARSKHGNGLWRVSFCTGMVLHPEHSPGQSKWLEYSSFTGRH